MTMTDLCQELKNYFLRNRDTDIHIGTFRILDGNLQADFLLPGQFFRIVGSVLNDGVWQYPAEGLKTETFSGAVWAMAVPPAVVALAAEINDWETANKAALDSPYQSESFAGYSYSLKSGGTSASGAVTWQAHFRDALNRWRRIQV